MTDLPRKFVDRIAQAIGDPGSILPRNHHSLGQPSESVTRWSTRAVLEVLVASGYRREEDVIFAAWDAAAKLLDKAAKGARQRGIGQDYAEGLADAASTLAETVAELRAQRPATALEQAQPLPVAASPEVEPVEPCGSDIGVFRPRRCVLPKGHGGDWHDDGSACWSVKEPSDG